MRRRCVLLGITAVLGGCRAGRPPADARPSSGAPAAVAPSSPAPVSPPLPVSPSPEVSLPPMAPVLSSTGRSQLSPRPVQPYQPPPGVAPPARRAVGRRDLTFHRAGRTLPVRVWYPAAAGSDVVPAAAPAAGRFPLMLFSHGLTNQPDDYAPLLTAWARAGLVVAAPRYPHTAWGADAYDPGDIVHQPADASHVVTALLTGDHPLAGHLDADRVGAGGHSAGGITTAGLLSRVRDVRVKAAMIVAGTDFGGTPFLGPPAAVLFVHGARDRTVTWTAGHTVFAAVPWSRAMLTLTRGGHVLRGAELATVTEFSTDFLRWSLYGDPAARRRLPDAARARGVATLEDQL